MSIHIDTLRDIASNGGYGVCDEVADEIEDHERAYALLFNENAKLRALVELIFSSTCPYKENGEPTLSDEVAAKWRELSPSTGATS